MKDLYVFFLGRMPDGQIMQSSMVLANVPPLVTRHDVDRMQVACAEAAGCAQVWVQFWQRLEDAPAEVLVKPKKAAKPAKKTAKRKARK